MHSIFTNNILDLAFVLFFGGVAFYCIHLIFSIKKGSRNKYKLGNFNLPKLKNDGNSTDNIRIVPVDIDYRFDK